MSWSQAFVELDKSKHERGTFECGEAELNDFLKTKAAKHMKAGISKTMVLPGELSLPNGLYPICAFYAIAPGSIKRESLPPKLAKKLPTYPMPVFLIAQLAVHSAYHGQGLGKVTLIKALEYLWKVNTHMKAYAIVVDCLNESAKNFYAKYGFQVLNVDGARVRIFIPMKTVEQLFG